MNRLEVLKARIRILVGLARWYIEDLAHVAIPCFVVVGVVRAAWAFWSWVF